MEILTSEKKLDDMIKETISTRRRLEKIDTDYTLRKRKNSNNYYKSNYSEINE